MIMNIFGFMLSNWMTFAFSFAGGGVAWRIPLVLQFIFIFILFGTVPWLPERSITPIGPHMVLS